MKLNLKPLKTKLMGISKKKLKAENKDLNERLGVAECNHLWACDDLV